LYSGGGFVEGVGMKDEPITEEALIKLYQLIGTGFPDVFYCGGGGKLYEISKEHGVREIIDEGDEGDEGDEHVVG